MSIVPRRLKRRLKGELNRLVKPNGEQHFNGDRAAVRAQRRVTFPVFPIKPSQRLILYQCR